jgi:hypothetical protein
MSILGVTGSRTIKDPRVIDYVLSQIREDLGTIKELHHGNAIGVDRLAAVWAADRRIKIVPHHPAGTQPPQFLERDRKLVETVETVVAIWDGTSRGTKYTLDYARKLGRLHSVWKLADIVEELGLDLPM